MRMKRVLIVAPDFVPSSLPPALRVRFFASHLPSFGWEPTILTVDPRFYENAFDPENERLLPDSLRVIRTPAFAAEVTRKLGVGDLGMRSLWQQWRALSALCRRERFDVLFISVPPFVPMVLGRLANRRFGIPYVIDYIDPWVSAYYWGVPRAQRPPKWIFAHAMSLVLEPFALRGVSHLVGVSKGTTDGILARYRWLDGTQATEIPYGGEPDDFQYLCQHPRHNRIFDCRDGNLHVSSVGRGGSDLFPVLRAVFETVRMGIKRAPQVFSRLRLHFVGTTYAPNGTNNCEILALARECGVEDYVDEHPARVPYLDALAILLKSHALLAAGSESVHYTASKIFPYILARRPLLAIFHEASNVVRTIQETQAGEVVCFGKGRPPSDLVPEIGLRLEGMLSLPHSYEPKTDWPAFEAYTTRRMGERLAAVFDNCLKREPSSKRLPGEERPNDFSTQH